MSNRGLKKNFEANWFLVVNRRDFSLVVVAVGRTLDALRLTRFQREAAVSGLGSSKKETVLSSRRAKSSACHLHSSSQPQILSVSIKTPPQEGKKRLFCKL
jgi:hypothetical protein